MSTKRKKRKHWWHNIRFKYRLTITNENTLEDIVTLHVIPPCATICPAT